MIINDFIKALSEREGLRISRVRLTPKNRSVYKLSGKLNCLLSLHYISHPPYRWGVTANVVEKLKTQPKPWAVVLFYDSHETGYLLSSTDVIYYTENIWPLAGDGDYKPAPGTYLAKNVPFRSLDEFFRQLTSMLSLPFNIEVALENAKQEAYRLRKSGTGESELHKQIKNHVREHPECIGLVGTVSVSMEYAFPSGDQVDVAFEFSGNHWTVVEIEVEGLTQTLVGLFQSVKYKALQQAVLVSKNLHGSVEGVLVAKSIPPEVKSLAKLLEIKTFEVRV